MIDNLSDHEAERTVLGAVLVDNATLSSVESLLRPEHFHRSQHRFLFSALQRLGSDGRSIDLVTVRDELQGTGDLEAAGGTAYIAGLVDGLPRMSNVGGWAKIVREKARRRSLIAIAERVISRAHNGVDDTDEILDGAHASLMRLLESGENQVQRIDHILPETIKGLEAFANRETDVVGVPTGIPDLDKLTSGLRTGTLWVIGARPSRGKSSLLTQISVHAAQRSHKVLVFAMEMAPPDVVERMLLSDADMERWGLRTNENAWARVLTSYGRLKDLPIWFDGRESPTLAQMRASAKQQKAAHGLDLVVVDYIQRASLDPKLERWVAVGEIVKGLKSLARSLNIPVLAACQLTAKAEESRPTLADLQQAQSIISAEADLVGFLSPKDIQAWKDHKSDVVHLLVDKHRQGATMAIPLEFRRSVTKFVNLARVA